ncbi:hypothetical protein OIU34_02525 [Pararhizobium sp. BT-229]|uniref:hypothetical protein n=1 Tax=Pararhizobium sp. BT-229 TaxID=2986923 RepID=UPI0021F71381|nr:hypothetical protein [Pararhizobium sp. BT-229]MCV9960763.1 hypothetical protein [Pararhizobium sp. BT-229]
MKARQATAQDLRQVFSDLAQRCLDEVETAGYTLEKAKSIFRGLRRDGRLWALELNGEAIGLIGFEESEAVGAPFIGTYFFGRERFFSPDVPSVRFGKRFMRAMQRQFGNLPMVSMCYGNHPKIERWYRLMGYRLAETFDVQRNFVLDPADLS